MGLNTSSNVEEVRGSYSVDDLHADLDKYEQLYVTKTTFDKTKDSTTGLTVLDGSYKGLRRIFPSTLRYRNIHVLKLNCNYLRAFPNDLTILTNLRELYLHENNFEFLPLQICSIRCLKVLNLSCNQLQSLPEPIGNLTTLNKLDVSFNQLSSLPVSLHKLSNLQCLNLDGNRFLEVPSCVFQLHSLNELRMSANMLTTIPKGILLLSNLEELYVNENFIEEVVNVLKEFLLELRVFEFVNNKCVRLVQEIDEKKDCLSH